MERLPTSTDPAVLVGHGGADDAGVYRLSDEMALVLTVDFFTPIVDDPVDFGRIAAVNSLSDVYAMGGRPLVALNVAGFPEKKLPPAILGSILVGGVESATRAGCAVVGGHTVDDDELKYGLAVVGTVHPDRVITNAGAQPGNKLILTKPLGTGLLSTALKKGKLDGDGVRRLVEVMTTLNDKASEQMADYHVTACTDITGFGLIGHAFEMAKGSGVSIRIDSSAVPLIEGALWAAKNGYITGGANNNRAFVKSEIEIAASVDANILHSLFDPQTSGGLLMAVPPSTAEPLSRVLKDVCPQAAVIGECAPQKDRLLEIR